MLLAGDYQPTSRRPIAGVLRRTAAWAVDLCVRHGIHPDAVSYGSVVVSAVGAGCFLLAGRWPVLLILGPLFCFLRLWLNMLDGMVALAAGKATPRGEILNDLPDRISDVLIFAGVAHSGLCAAYLAYWAAIFALLTAYVGTLGQAAGARREYSGVMSKPWRMVVVSIGAWITFVVIYAYGRNASVGRLTILDWTCIIVIVGCVQTIALRLKRIFTALGARQADLSSGSTNRRA